MRSHVKRTEPTEVRAAMLHLAEQQRMQAIANKEACARLIADMLAAAPVPCWQLIEQVDALLETANLRLKHADEAVERLTAQA